MRLPVVEHGHRLREKLMLAIIRLSGRRAPDILRTILYRPEFFGRQASSWTQAVMRGSSQWSVGERELFAALTSKLNQCPF